MVTSRYTLRAVTDPRPSLTDDWDRLVNGTEAADVTQLSSWARLRRRAGYRSRHLLVTDGDELVGGAQILCRGVPGLGKIGYLAYGPLVFGPDVEGITRCLCAALVRTAQAELAALFVQPPADGAPIAAELVGRGLVPSSVAVAPAATIRIDLGPSEDELRRRLSTRLGRWTKQWARRGVTVRIGRRADIAVLAALLGQTAAFHRFESYSADYLDALYGELQTGGNSLIMIGEVDGTPAAVDLLTVCGGVLKARLTGLDRTSEGARLKVSAAVTWASMLHAKETGLRWYDFGGIRPSGARLLADGAVDRNSLEGPDRFKADFGGTLLTYPTALQLVPSRTARLGLRILESERAKRLNRTVRAAFRGTS